MPRIAAISAVVLISAAVPAAALASTYHGKTSQGKKIEVQMAAHSKLSSLLIVFSTRCSDKHKRQLSTAFVRPFRDPQNAAGVVGDSIHVLGGNFFNSGGFKQTASFSATVRPNHISGTAHLTETLLPSGVRCRSGRVHFRLNI